MLTPIKDRRHTVVRVNRPAIIDMLIATIEAVMIPPMISEHSKGKVVAFERHQRRWADVFQMLPLSLLFSNTCLPIYGILFGRELHDQESVTFVVERMFVSSTNRHDFGLWPSPNSSTVMAKVADAAGLEYEVIGDFRSRPCLDQSPKEIDLSCGYKWKRETETGPEFKDDRVSLAMTITHATGEMLPALPLQGPAMQFRFNKWEIWLATMLRDRRTPTQGPELVVEAPFI